MIPRFTHIVVPLDFKPNNQHALDVAFEVASSNEAKVTLAHVIERLGGDAEDEEIEEFYERLRVRADAELEFRSQRFEEFGIKVDRKVLLGKPVRELVQYLTDSDIDLVVLSSHPLDQAHPAESFATLSYQIAVLSPAAVLLAK